VRAEGVLGAVEEEVAEAGVGIVGETVDEVQREAVAHPDAGFVAPVVGPRLLVGTGAADGEHAGQITRGQVIDLFTKKSKTCPSDLYVFRA